MRALIACFWLMLAAPVAAQIVTVKSGEHDSFSRLVLFLPSPVDWQFGRTKKGYELRLPGKGQSFDLSQVYDLIPRTRLASIAVDPVSSALQLELGCACHAMPFEFRPGIIVIDLKDGPPPSASSFELALDGGPLPVLGPPADVLPRRNSSEPAVSYDWMSAAKEEAGKTPAALPGLANPEVESLRDALLRQLSQGAAQGLVEIAEPFKGTIGAVIDPKAQLRIGASPGFVAEVERPRKGTLLPRGEECLPDERTDIAAWADERPVAEQIAEAQAGLIGEFDLPDAVAVDRAIKFYLNIGFGAEAAQLISAMPEDSEDRNIWRSMAKSLDRVADPEGAFKGMQVCDTAAAMWAVLAMPQLRVTDNARSAAVLRTFSALPLHLRRYLGPFLADQFIGIGDAATARALRDAIVRATGDAGPGVALMEADLDIAEGKPEAATAKLETLVAQSGPVTTEALLSLVDAQLKQDKPIKPETVTALAALMHEHKGTESEPRIRRAHLLAEASAGDFESAFDQLETVPDAAADLWHLLAEKGPDSAVLAHAILPADRAPPGASVETRKRLADRLLGLGFPDQALTWLDREGRVDPLLAAKAELERKGGQAALRLIAGQTGAEAEALRGNALAGLDEPGQAATAFAAAGDAAAQMRALGWSRDWPGLAANGPEAWRAAAQLVTTPSPEAQASEPSTPLARSRALLAESAAARQTIEALLSKVPAPVPTE